MNREVLDGARSRYYATSSGTVCSDQPNEAVPMREAPWKAAHELTKYDDYPAFQGGDGRTVCSWRQKAIGREEQLSKSYWQECMCVHLIQRSIRSMLIIESSYLGLVLMVHHKGVLRGARVWRI